MKTRYILSLIAGLILVAYVLEALVPSLDVDLKNQFQYAKPENLSTYTFTNALIAARAIALFLIPVGLMGFFAGHYKVKSLVLLLLAVLSQLYVWQEIATGNKALSLEWALAISLAGILLLVPVAVYFLRSLVSARGIPLEEGEVIEEEEIE